MRTVCANGRGGIELSTVSEPLVGRGEIGIDSVCSLISSGTEMHYSRQIRPDGSQLPLGYCAAGIVNEVGDGCNGFSIGDPVIAMGWGYAVHAERIRVPQRLCVKIGRGLPFPQAVMANLGATALHAVHRAGPLAPENRVLVMGAGLVGQLVARVARLNTANVIVTDRVKGRVAVARAAGFTTCAADEHLAVQIGRYTDGQGVDVIFLCGSGPDGFQNELCCQVLQRAPDRSRRGVIVCVGRFPVAFEANADVGNVDIRISARCGTGYRDDAYVHGFETYAAPLGEATVDVNLRRCLALIEDGRIEVSDLVTHQVPFARAPEAYKVLDDVEHTLGVVLFHERNVTKE